METRSQEEVIIRIPQDTIELAIYPTPILAISEEFEEVIYIETVKDSTQDCSLSHTILHREKAGETRIPPDIGKLVHINKDKKSDIDGRQATIHYSEQQTVSNKVKV